MSSELWKPVKGYETLYEVSNLGNVRSLDKKVKNKYGYRYMPSKIMKPYKNKLGYLQVRLYKDGKNKNCYIHRLVAEAFLPNPNQYKEINHKDENPSNSIATNLEWCDRKYNINYGSHNEKMSLKKSKVVIQMDKNYEPLNAFDSLQQIQKTLGFSSGNICECCNGRRNSAYGYIWRYADE